MLTVDHISHTYHGVGGSIPALTGITFTVADGEFISIIGPSGCGKSTLLRIMAGLLVPTEGRVLLDGQTILTPQNRIGLLFQQPNLMPWRTVIDNVTLPLELSGVDQVLGQQQATDVLARVGLQGFENVYPAQLSGGMAQRVALARALIQTPDHLLLDEPFGALDALTREQMMVDLMTLCMNEHKTAIMVTHSITEAVFLADRVLVLSQRPGTVSAEVSVNLPRPRTLSMIHSTEFGRLVQEIRSNIHSTSL